MDGESGEFDRKQQVKGEESDRCRYWDEAGGEKRCLP